MTTHAEQLKAIADIIGPKTIETPDIKTTEHDLNTLDRMNEKSKSVSPMFHNFGASVAVPVGHRCILRPSDTSDTTKTDCC